MLNMEDIKKEARLLQKTQGIKYNSALNDLSQKNGFKNFHAFKKNYETSKEDVFTLYNVGYSEKQIEQLIRLSKMPSGIIIFSGPTTSGKQTSSNIVSNLIKERRKSDSVKTVYFQNYYENSNEVSNADIILKLNKSYEENKELLSSDFFSEMRTIILSKEKHIFLNYLNNSAVANYCFNLAMSGEKLICKMHTGSAFSSFLRLKDFSIENYKILDSSLLNGVVNHQLVRKVCPHCSINISEAEQKGLTSSKMVKKLHNISKENVDNISFANSKGCNHCNSGYIGRELIAEIIIPDDRFKLFFDHNPTKAKTDLEFKDGESLKNEGIRKMIKGIIDPIDLENYIGDY